MEEQSTSNSGAGSQPETTSVNDRVDNLIKRLAEAEKRLDERANEIASLKLAGKSEAGQPQEVKVETAQEYAKRILSNKK